MFTTQRTARGAALVASAAFGLGGTLAPATLAPASFVPAAHAQPHGATSAVNQPASRDANVDVFIMDLIGQSEDYILINLGGVKSLDHVQMRLVAVTVDGSEIASMVVPSSQLTVSKNDDGYLDVSIHQRLNIEQVYMVEVTDFLTGDSSFVELDPEYGESVEGLVASSCGGSCAFEGCARGPSAAHGCSGPCTGSCHFGECIAGSLCCCF